MDMSLLKLDYTKKTKQTKTNLSGSQDVSMTKLLSGGTQTWPFKHSH